MHVHIETEMSAPARIVWEVLAHDFARIDAWSSTVESSSAVSQDELPEGAIADPRAPVAGRETTTAFATLREYFSAYDEDRMEFTFQAVGVPFFISQAQNTTRVTELGPGRSKVVFVVEIRLRGPFVVFDGLLKRRFTKAMQAVHGDLKAFVERRALAAPATTSYSAAHKSA